jgi:uncharacterized protein
MEKVSMRPSEVLPSHRETIKRLVLESGMVNPRVFGRVARGEDPDGGELDLLVDMTMRSSLVDLGRVERLIADATGVPVNLLVPGDLPPKFRDRVLAEAAPL